MFKKRTKLKKNMKKHFEFYTEIILINKYLIQLMS